MFMVWLSEIKSGKLTILSGRIEEKFRETNYKRCGINVNEIKLHTTGEALFNHECTQMVEMFADSWVVKEMLNPHVNLPVSDRCSFVSRSFIQSFIHSVVCLTTVPKPLPNRALHIVRSRASSIKWEYPLLSLRSSSIFLRLLPRLPVTSIPPVYLSFNNPL